MYVGAIASPGVRVSRAVALSCHFRFIVIPSRRFAAPAPHRRTEDVEVRVSACGVGIAVAESIICSNANFLRFCKTIAPLGPSRTSRNAWRRRLWERVMAESGTESGAGGNLSTGSLIVALAPDRLGFHTDVCRGKGLPVVHAIRDRSSQCVGPIGQTDRATCRALGRRSLCRSLRVGWQAYEAYSGVSRSRQYGEPTGGSIKGTTDSMTGPREPSQLAWPNWCLGAWDHG